VTLALFLLQAPGGGGGIGGLLFTFASIGLVFYLLVFRPQQKQQQRHQQMLGNLKSGDRVVTRGGLRGTIVGLKEKEEAIILRIPPDQVKLEVLRSAVEAVERPEEEEKSK
jgi:preprotein translocase subunit YajC